MKGIAKQEIIKFINNNIFHIMNKKSGRMDYTAEDGTKVKIYKCGSDVTRIDIVEEEEYKWD